MHSSETDRTMESKEYFRHRVSPGLIDAGLGVARPSRIVRDKPGPALPIEEPGCPCELKAIHM